MKTRREFAILTGASALALAGAQAEAGASGGLPFEYASDHAPLIVAEGAIGARRERVAVVVDTGATAPFAVFISEGMANHLSLAQSAVITPPDTTAVGPRRPTYRVARLDRFVLGPVDLGPAEVAVLPMIDAMGAGVGRRIDAIVGEQFLRDHAFSIDHGARRIDLAAALGAEAQAIPFVLAARKPLILVQATVNGAGSFVMQIDTGASATLLSPSAAARAGVVALGQGAQGGAGGSVAVGVGKAEVLFGGVSRALAPVAISEAMTSISAAAGSPIDGILGLDFFKGSRLTIDYASRRLWMVAGS